MQDIRQIRAKWLLHELLTGDDIIKNMLSAKVLYGLNKENTSRDSYIPSDIYYALQRKSRGNLGYGKRQQSTLEGTLTFQHKFGELLDMNLMARYGTLS